MPPTGGLAQALARWATFPTNATPRPLVLTGDTVLAPALGFKTGDAKIAFGSGNFTAPATPPASPPASGGYPLVSAPAALAFLKIYGGGFTVSPPVTTAPLVITSVQLGPAAFSTDRGTTTLPAWLFYLAGMHNRVAVLAVSPSGRFSSPTAPQGPAAVGARLGPDGRTLTVTFVGAAAGPGPCAADYTGEVAESPVAVAVAVHPVARPTPTVTVVCTGEGYDRQVIVALAAPLGGRVVVDNAGIAVTVTS